MPAFDPRDIRSLEDAFWSAVAGEGAPERRRAILSRVLSSPEFDALRSSWKTPAPAQNPASVERGSDEGFVRVAYECVLGRPADENGLRHYTSALAAGESRAGVLRALATSDEFE